MLRDALEVDPRSVEARLALGDVLEAEGHVIEAAEEFRRGLDVERNNGSLYLKLAVLSQKQKRSDEAEAIYHQWIDVAPTDVERMSLAQLYGMTGRAKEAVESYQRARQVDPSSRFAHEGLITFYLETNRLKEAELEIAGMLKQNPMDIGGRMLQARLKLERGEADEAMNLLQDVVRQVPRSATVHQYIGIAWARMNKLPEAISALKVARTLDPKSATFARIWRRCTCLRVRYTSPLRKERRQYNPMLRMCRL